MLMGNYMWGWSLLPSQLELMSWRGCQGSVSAGLSLQPALSWALFKALLSCLQQKWELTNNPLKPDFLCIVPQHVWQPCSWENVICFWFSFVPNFQLTHNLPLKAGPWSVEYLYCYFSWNVWSGQCRPVLAGPMPWWLCALLQAFMAVQRVIETYERHVLLSYNYFLPYCLP